MVCQQHLNDQFAQLQNLLRMGLHPHPFKGGGRTGSHQASAFDFHQAEPAGAIDAQFGVVAEGGNLYMCLAGQRQDIGLAFPDHGTVIYIYDLFSIHLSLLLGYSFEFTGGGAGTAFDADHGVDLVGRFHFPGDGSHGADSFAECATAA